MSPAQSPIRDHSPGCGIVPHLQCKQFPKLQAGPKETNLNLCHGTVYNACDVLDGDSLDISKHEDRSCHWIQTLKAVFQYAGRLPSETALLIVIRPNRKVTNHQVVTRIGALIERKAANTFATLRKCLFHRNCHEPHPQLLCFPR